MALDTRGLMDGALKGFSVMDNYYRGQAQDARAERGLQMQEENFGLQKERFGMQKEQAGQQQAKEKATFVLGKIAQGVEPSEDEYEFLKQNPQYWPALDPNTDKDIDIAQRVVDPNDPTDANSPEAIEAMNRMFGHRINRGEGGRKRIAMVVPGQQPGTVAFDLEVETEDGRKYNAPMTKNRGTEGDDEVMQVPVEKLIEPVQGYRVIRNAFRTPEAQATANKVLAALTGKQSQAEPVVVNNKLVDPKTGKVIGDYSDKDSDRYSAPAEVKTAEWMVANGLAPSLDVAFNRVNESRTDPTKFVNDFVTQEMKYQESSGVYPGDEGYRTPNEMREQAIETLQMIRSRTRGESGQPSAGQPRGIEMIDSEVEQLPADGSAVQREDGSYAGRVNRNPNQAPSPLADPVVRQQASQVKADFKAGKITREQAVSQLRNLGFQ